MSKKKYKCPYCEKRLEKSRLISHIDKYHNDVIPEGYSASRVAFNSINKKEHGTCVICKKESPWNEDKCRYDRLCKDPECHKKYKTIVEERIKRTYGTDSKGLLNNPEHQKKMLAGRKISGSYKWSDGTIKTYTGQYEKKTLEFFDKTLNCLSEDVEAPGPVFNYTYNGETHTYISDIYYSPYKLVIECKDGGDNPNNRPMKEYREKQLAKEKSIIEDNRYNYLRLTNNNFEQLLLILTELKMQLIDDNSNERIIRINENAALSAISYMPPTSPNNTYIVSYMMPNVFSGENDHNIGITKDIKLNSIFTQDKFDKICKINSDNLKESTYTVYKSNDSNIDEKYNIIKSKLNTKQNMNYIYETVFEKKLYTKDQICIESSLEEVQDIYSYLNEVSNVVYSNIMYDNNYNIPLAENNIYDNIQYMLSENGYYIVNKNTGLQSPYYNKKEDINNVMINIIKGGVL